MFLTGGTWYWGVLDTYSVKRTDVEPFPYPRFADGKDIGGVGYGYCLYVSKLCQGSRAVASSSWTRWPASPTSSSSRAITSPA